MKMEYLYLIFKNQGENIFASRGDEWSGPGALLTSFEELPIIPVISSR